MKYTGALSLADRRSLSRIERLAADVERQCGFLRRNMADHDSGDRARWMSIAYYARALLAEAELGKRRYQRDHPPQNAARG